jgi:hypothetical protein
MGVSGSLPDLPDSTQELSRESSSLARFSTQVCIAAIQRRALKYGFQRDESTSIAAVYGTIYSLVWEYGAAPNFRYTSRLQKCGDASTQKSRGRETRLPWKRGDNGELFYPTVSRVIRVIERVR